MVISYNQNLHFIIHCKKTPKTMIQFISSYSDTTKISHNDMNIEFIAEVYAYLYYWKHESKIIAWNEIKTTNKFYDISNRFDGFFTTNAYNSSHFSPNYVFKNSFPLS
jgi:hypothetical protein